MGHVYSHNYFFPFFFEGRWASALPAADFAALLVFLLRSTEDAALAAFWDVTLLGALVCDRALPDAVLDLGLVDLFLSVEDAFRAALGLVTFAFVIVISFSCFGLGVNCLDRFFSADILKIEILNFLPRLIIFLAKNIKKSSYFLKH